MAWGGRRIHEGTDLFAGYGVPIQSTSYGTVELIGWNNYGGWRVGIRDLDNIYHYYAHLSGFEKGLEKGDVVKPGQVVGYCGSSGYGKPGTQGKFPPHLHYGMYRDNGVTEWSFDPYPLLKSWRDKLIRIGRGKDGVSSWKTTTRESIATFSSMTILCKFFIKNKRRTFLNKGMFAALLCLFTFVPVWVSLLHFSFSSFGCFSSIKDAEY
ncbi:M23 family metallopeptidase [Alkalicoccobacillus plakortidis]|uniref:M23 family metallopeptidase n=1 Tax=Alkalicoccobacillus plakortidis TaxID=444060 RepID=UPI00358DD563